MGNSVDKEKENQRKYREKALKARHDHDEKLARWKKEKEDADREAENEKDKRDKAHNLALKKLEDARATAKEAAERKEREDKEKRKQTHELAKQAQIDAAETERKRMLQEMADAEAERERARKKEQEEHLERIRRQKIKQRDVSLKEVKEEIAKCEQAIDQSKLGVVNAKSIVKEKTESLAALENKINGFDAYKEQMLKILDDAEDLKVKKQRFDENNDEIEEAIKKTGQTEQNVARFLKLTSKMLEATTVTTMDTNRMSTQIKTFETMINRECSDKLTIEQYADEEEELKPLVGIFRNDGKVNMHTLKCNDNEEFEDLVSMVNTALAKQQEEMKDDTPKDSEERPGQTEETKQEEVSPEALLKQWNLHKFWESMKEEGWDDPNDWPEIEEEDLKGFGFKKGNIKRWMRALNELKNGGNDEGGDLLSAKALGVLRRICMKPEEWEELEREQGEAAKAGLESVSPVLGDFFDSIYKGVKDASLMLACTEEVNEKQMKAIEMTKEQVPSPENEEDDEKEPANQQAINVGNSALRMEWAEGSECEVYSETMKKWCNAKIVAIREHDDDGVEWLKVEYEGISEETGTTKELERASPCIRPRFAVEKKDDMMRVQSYALKEAACSELCVTQKMMQRFEANEQTKRALTVAVGVEDCCKQVMMSQGTIRESLLLARAIWKMKPSNMKNEKCKELWDVVDDGAVRLMDSAIKMTKASDEFFGFFLRFRQSFLWYQSNKDRSLATSMKNLRIDCREFTSFQEKFLEQVETLNAEALRVIKECVKKQSGAESFEAHQAQRKKNQDSYLAAKAKHDLEEARLNAELDKLHADKATMSAAKARAVAEIQNLESTIEQNSGFLDQFQNVRKNLEGQII